MSQNKIAIISKNTGSLISLQENLNEICVDTYTVSSIEDILEKYIYLPFVLTIIDADSYGEDTLKLIRYLRGAKPTPIINPEQSLITVFQTILIVHCGIR